jgi:hypothetical protein
MITPQMPTGGAVSQPILHDAPHGGFDHAMGVMTVGHGQIQHVGVEVTIAMPAVVLGISDMQIAWPAADGIAQIVQRALGGPQARGAAVTQRTAPARKVA